MKRPPRHLQHIKPYTGKPKVRINRNPVPPPVRQKLAPPEAPRVIVIFGPTSSGKTTLSLELAERLPKLIGREIEVIGADSRQVYVGMNIGTSKVGRDITERIPHHCIDMRPPDKMVGLTEYQAFTLQRIKEIHERGNVPVMVGGTGSYILSVTENWNVGEDLRPGEENFKDRGKGLALVRATYFRSTLGMNKIVTRIDSAVDFMMENGLTEEVIHLWEQYKLWEPNRLQRNALWHTHGYREFLEQAHAVTPVRLNPSRKELPDIVAAIKEHTRAYALRQWSWQKKMPPVTPVASGAELAKKVQETGFLGATKPTP
ncbi:hypothetical protein LBMAG21_15200 [Armatimonadota bacterium]|nr:hypothetical protein LBMAG21_15200 [Armatimonadota bacterium]